LNVLSVTAPIFLVIALGFTSARSGFLAPHATQALGAFVLRIAMPALIFKALASRPLAEVADLRLIAAYAGASALSFGSVFALFARGERRRAAMRALGAAAPNSGFVGFPIATLLFGPKAAVGLALCLIVENVLTLPLGLALAESGAGLAPLAGRLVRNPLLIAIAAGVVASLTGLAPPAPVARAIDVLAAAAPGAALIAIGGALVGLKIGGDLLDIVPVAAGKLALHPLLMLVFASFAVGADPDVRSAMLVMSSAPAFSIYPLICRAYGQEKAGAAILLVETALAFPTMSAWALAF
jgi:predicted permease